MPRIPYSDFSQFPAEERAELQANAPNVTRIMAAASEPVFRTLGALGSAFINGSPLPPKLREIAILRVGYLSQSEYETFQHEALARHVGLSDAEIIAVQEGNGNALDKASAAVLKFVEDIVRNVRAGDETLAAVRAHLDDTQVTDLILVTGYYMLVCRLLETAGVELDEAPIDWSTMAKKR